jgi:hypothetical protein
MGVHATLSNLPNMHFFGWFSGIPSAGLGWTGRLGRNRLSQNNEWGIICQPRGNGQEGQQETNVAAVFALK